jgi:predicted transposase YbfD/YdcC
MSQNLILMDAFFCYLEKEKKKEKKNGQGAFFQGLDMP